MKTSPVSRPKNTAVITASDGQQWVVASFFGPDGSFEAVYDLGDDDSLVLVTSYYSGSGPGIAQPHNEFWGSIDVHSVRRDRRRRRRRVPDPGTPPPPPEPDYETIREMHALLGPGSDKPFMKSSRFRRRGLFLRRA